MARITIRLALLVAALALAGCELRPATSPPLGANPQDAEFAPPK